MNEHLSKEEKKKNLTLDAVRNDYNKYGYLEDYQVEWLINEVANNYTFFVDLIENAERQYNAEKGIEVELIEMSPELLQLIKQKINYGS